MFKLTIHYMTPANPWDGYKLNPNHYRVVEGNDLVELLSKFLIEVVQLQRFIYEEELLAHKIKRMEDDIPF